MSVRTYMEKLKKKYDFDNLKLCEIMQLYYMNIRGIHRLYNRMLTLKELRHLEYDNIIAKNNEIRKLTRRKYDKKSDFG